MWLWVEVLQSAEFQSAICCGEAFTSVPVCIARRMKYRVEFGTRSLVIANLGRKRIPRGICPAPSRDYSRQNSNFQGAGEEACACRHEYSSVGTSCSLGHNRHHHSWLIARDQTSQQS